ncbi:MAG TPA: type II toxin-antitoxin system PemK/MazF family toxin, partial [Candidatus Berkiella sp.]|nr:type II toxin-antitoxin system PemK/MazF family toxin [Candidatus Berkiella sp.]
SRPPFNLASSLLIVCPITPTIRSSPWGVTFPTSMKTKGIVRADHVKSIDKERCKQHHHRIEIIETAPSDVVEDAQALLDALILQ